MKQSEERWMHIPTGLLTERGRNPIGSVKDEYELVTVVRTVPEWEEVEVVEYAHNHYYDGLYNYRYTTRKEAIEALDVLRHRQTCEVVEIKSTYRRRKPEPEVWEGKIYQDGLVMVAHLPKVSCDRTDLVGKKVEVRVK